MQYEDTQPLEISREGGTLYISGNLITQSIGRAEAAIRRYDLSGFDTVDGAGIELMDTAGAVLIKRIAGERLELRGFHDKARRLISMVYEIDIPAETPPPKKEPLSLESIGGNAFDVLYTLEEVAILIVDILYFGVRDLFDRKHYRKGSFTEQAYYMGSTALPIVGTILFLIGAILALQGAAQLRQFGAAIFVVDLLAIGLATEFAPLLTAILISGRTGSAIASEIATMKFTEEIDAIKTLGLNPIRFVVVPKLWAMMISMPLLSVMALLIGIFGGFVVAILYMNLTPSAFISELFRALKFQDIFNGLIKTISFAIIIVVVGTWNGLNFSGGADGVGRATTNAVVAAIFGIIVADAIWSIIFYFRF